MQITSYNIRDSPRRSTKVNVALYHSQCIRLKAVHIYAVLVRVHVTTSRCIYAAES